MCAARFNGCAEEAAGPAAASRMLDWTEASPRILHSLEMGTVMTLFYQKKSQRPERRTFQIKPDMRLVVWSRNPDKPEGESEYHQRVLTGTGTGTGLGAGLGRPSDHCTHLLRFLMSNPVTEHFHCVTGSNIACCLLEVCLKWNLNTRRARTGPGPGPELDLELGQNALCWGRRAPAVGSDPRPGGCF